MTDPTASTPATEPGQNETGFEGLVQELERIVTRLERGEQSLEEALADFERGTSTADRASKILDSAQARVDQLLEGRGGVVREEPFEAEYE